MSMGITPEEAMATNNNNNNNNEYYSHAIAKGKRTKRQKLLQVSAPVATATSSTSSSAELSGSTTTVEEEDMANCLILLAQGQALDDGSKQESRLEEEGGGEKFTSRRFAEAATTTNGKAGFYVYECKTCNKCFPSFQALGGHRASHKKPKMTPPAAMTPEEKKAIDEDGLQISIASFPKPITAPNTNKSRVHECSICGSEFSSGQALGGHMRRHRPAATVPESPEVNKKEKSLLSLDLNLPAPSDDERGDFSKSPASFTFASKQSIIFSTSSLVDCHY